MTKRSLFLTLSATLLLSACGSTFEGLKKDWSSLSTATSERFSELTQQDQVRTNISNAVAPQCIDIIVDPQLDSLSEFEDMKKPSPQNLVSTATLTGVTSNCKTSDDGEFLEMRLDIALSSELGPKARRVESDQPFFAYPYFITVKNAEGTDLATEIFAASVTYESDQNSVNLVETINQRLPLNDDGSTPDYQVHVGFQLTDEQLFYNASL